VFSTPLGRCPINICGMNDAIIKLQSNVLRALYTLSYLILMEILGKRYYYYSHFAGQ
jgi:hypothetical protein